MLIYFLTKHKNWSSSGASLNLLTSTHGGQNCDSWVLLFPNFVPQAFFMCPTFYFCHSFRSIFMIRKIDHQISTGVYQLRNSHCLKWNPFLPHEVIKIWREGKKERMKYHRRYISMMILFGWFLHAYFTVIYIIFIITITITGFTAHP